MQEDTTNRRSAFAEPPVDRRRREDREWMEDADLLRRFVFGKSEAAFAELVRRHLNLVYSVALRQVAGDAHLAEDVTQQVFTALARKAAALAGRPALSGWLYRSAHFAASDVVRVERRRRAREQEVHAMNSLPPDPAAPADWEKIRPVLDAAIAELDERDRDAVALRFFDGRSFADVGARLQLTENAARMRVERALDKLHALLAKRGLTSTASALGVALANQAVAVAPAGLAASVTGAALGGAAVAGAGSLAAAIAFMSSSKISLSIAAAGALAVGLAINQSSQARAAAATLAEAQRGNATLAARTAELNAQVSATEKERADREATLERRRTEKTAAATPAPAAPVDDINAKYREILNRLTQNDAELAKVQAVHKRMQTAETFRPLFLSLDFTPQQIERAVEIVMKPLPQSRDEFRAAFGEPAAGRFADFRSDEALAARTTVNELSAKLYFNDAPFTAQQTEQLVRIIQDASTEPRVPRQSYEEFSDVFRRTLNWDRIQTQAAAFLSSEQLRGLRALAAVHRNSELLAAAAQAATASRP